MADPYAEIAQALPNEVRVGGALITVVEPHVGFELDYNRWYEDDHFYSGAMAGPWMFSGRRFVAPRALRSQRAEVRSPIATPPEAGCYVSVYWMTAGQEDNAERWGYHAMADNLIPRGRGFTERTHVYTAFHRFHSAHFRDRGPLRAETCLAHPFAGLYTEVIDAETVPDFDRLMSWLDDDALPTTLVGSTAAACLAFAPVPFSQGLVRSGLKTDAADMPEVGRRICLLWFVDRDPQGGPEPNLESFHKRLADGGLGELRLSSAFIPTVPGTDRYVDELRGAPGP